MAKEGSGGVCGESGVDRKIVLAILGSTGTGKSKLGIELGKVFDGEVSA